MKTFLAIYFGTGDARSRSKWNELDQAERKRREAAGMEAWKDYGAANGAAIVDHGAPLAKTKRVSPAGFADITNAMTGYAIVRAESHGAVANMFENYPYFSIFPGDSVEVMECLPLPSL